MALNKKHKITISLHKNKTWLIYFLLVGVLLTVTILGFQKYSLINSQLETQNKIISTQKDELYIRRTAKHLPVANCANPSINQWTLFDTLSPYHIKIRDEYLQGGNRIEIAPSLDPAHFNIETYESIIINGVNITAGKTRNPFKTYIELGFYENNVLICKNTQALTFPAFQPNDYSILKVYDTGDYNVNTLRLPYGGDSLGNTHYITDCTSQSVLMKNGDNSYTKIIESKDLILPSDVKIHNDLLYVVDEGDHAIKVFDLEGVLIKTFKKPSERPAPHKQNDINIDLGYIFNPLGIGFGGDNIFITDYGNDRVQIFDQKFNFKKLIKNPLNIDGRWKAPYHIETHNKKDIVYIVERDANRVVAFDYSGKFLFSFGEDVLTSPHELAIDSNGLIYIANYHSKEIAVFDDKGTFIKSITIPPGLGLVKTISIDQTDNMIIGVTSTNVATSSLIQIKMKKPRDLINNEVNLPISPALNISQSKANMLECRDMGPECTHLNNLYAENCAGCHQAQIINSPLNGIYDSWHSYKLNDDQLVDLVFNNKSSFASLSCQDCSRETFKKLIQLMRPKMEVYAD